MSAEGEIRFRAPPFEEGLYRLELRASNSGVEPEQGAVADPLPVEASVYRALVAGTRDYVRKHGFPGVIIGSTDFPASSSGCQAESIRRL
jgi:NAD+ synthase (glutamine-hydrolysing)